MPTIGLVLVLGISLASAVPPAGAVSFVDVSQPAGIDVDDITYGLAWADFDDDGWRDLFVCRHYFRPLLHRNLDGNQFSHAFFPPLFHAQDHHGPLLFDFDEDGDTDIYMTGGADAGFSAVEKRLYRNDGDFTFVDVAPQWGVTDSLARGRSSSAMDVEGDGDVDFFVAKAPRSLSPNALFLRTSGETFVESAAAAGIADTGGSVGGVWGDYDRDGDPDLLVGGEELSSYATRLYRNEGNATFTNVTTSALPWIGQISSADWGDYDGDGDLDLAVGYGDAGLFDALHWSADSLTFFFNGRYDDNGLDALAFLQTADSSSFDVYLNGSYRPDDIWISSAGFHPPLTTPFVSGDDIVGAPSFLPGIDTGIYLWVQELAPVWELRFSAPPQSGATCSGLITPFGEISGVVASETEPFTPGPRGTGLWRNDGGVFVDVSASAGITDTVNVRHVAWVDLDQDGALDLHVLNKGDTQDWNLPDLVYRGNAGGTFTETAATWGLEGPEYGLGDAVAYGDYDADGDLDVATTSGSGPRYFARQETLRLYRNDGPVGNWLAIDLEGVTSSRPGYGAWITCWSATVGKQTRYVTGNAWRGSGTTHAPRFGLGADAVVDELRIEWPSGAVNLLYDVAANQRLAVIENHPSVDVPPSDPAPTVLRLAVGPNPAPGATVLSLSGRGEDPVRLEIFDSAGRRVLRRDLAPGVDRYVWEGRDDSGRRTSPGVYFARVRAGGRSDRVKIVRVGR